MYHMDVVLAISSAWLAPPFAGELRDGYVWGRGAIDDNGLGTIRLMALILMKRLGVSLDRDLILMAVADEEEGGENGARWMVENRWSEIECEYVWDEGGTGSEGIIGRSPVFAVSVSEKTSMAVTLRATGSGGHGSMARSHAGRSAQRCSAGRAAHQVRHAVR
jgi:acetylornithine deacetylase/succinyl-diaminopimelate desuccinylase-like protein